MTDDISTTLTLISVILGLIGGAIGSFIYFRVGLENRLTKLEAALPDSRLEGYETRLGDLEQKNDRTRIYIRDHERSWN